MKHIVLRNCLTILACLAGCSALAAGYRLAAPKPIELAETYSPVAGGHAAVATHAYNASGVSVYSFAATSIGMTQSEKGGNRYVGEPLQPPDDVEVDWAKFSLEITNAPAYKAGYVFYTGSTNAAERVIVANFGTFKLAWPTVTGEKVEVTYETGLRPSVVQQRLFWTSAPFNAPSVTLSKNYGVRVFGATNLFWQASATNQYGATVYDYGVHYNIENNVLQAYARQNADGTWTGPVGTIVVAYYDTGSYDHYLGCTVVQVSGPDPVYLTSRVGEELLPQNEHYDPLQLSYMPVVQSSQNQTDDPRAPYVFVQKRVSGQHHVKENRVFAISETLPGETGAKKAEVFWECADGFDVFWPFEQTCYHILWPDCPTVVLAKEGTVPGVTIPSIYVPSLLDWQDPSGVARIEESNLTLSGKGRFTLKLTNEKQDDFWLLPLQSALSSDDEVFDLATPVSVNVGSEALPAVTGASSKLAKLVASVDLTLPAFIFERQSPGRNWNPNLYHATDAVANDADPFSALASSVYFVNVSEKLYDAEVWWLRRYAKEGMAEALTLPILPQRYKAAWPGLDEVGTIVFSSGRGSAAGSYVSTGSALTLAAAESAGSVRYRFDPGEGKSFTAGFAFNPSPAAARTDPRNRKPGEVIDFAFGDMRLSFAVTQTQDGASPAVCTFRLGESDLRVTCPSNQWTRFHVTALTNEVCVYADARPLATVRTDLTSTLAAGYGVLTVGKTSAAEAAVGVAVDNPVVWSSALSASDISAMATNEQASVFKKAALCLDFEDLKEEADGTFASVDSASSRAFTGKGFAALRPGAPVWNDGVLRTTEKVTPRAYVQNTASALGYKPNVEHALVLNEGEGACSLFALRTDMNDASTPPVALVEYELSGKGAMRAFRVAMTNDWYAWPTLACEAGKKVPLFHPYDAMPSGASPDIENGVAGTDDETVTYRDRTGGWWARRNGDFSQFMKYIGETGFVTSGDPTQDLAGQTLPAANLEDCFDWGARPVASVIRPVMLAAAGGNDSNKVDTNKVVVVARRDAGWLLGRTATPLPVSAAWPKNPAVMSVAQVLSKPEYGLPGVYSMKTCAVVYPFWGYENDDTSDKSQNTHAAWVGKGAASNRVVKLIDPTRRKSVSIPVEKNFPDEYGFTLGPTGNLSNRKGLYYFQEMPANVADRLFVDITSAGTGLADVCLVGNYVDDGAGTKYLRANSLTAAERDGIKATFEKLKASVDATRQRKLDGLIEAVEKIYKMGDFQPSRQIGMVTNVEHEVWGKTMRCDVISNAYYAADHYALVATGEGSGYVTLVENDGPGAESLPVTFHVFVVTNALYCGQILPILDANNKLSEQVSLLYTAPLGKAADDYTFQWFMTDAPSDGHKPEVPSTPTASPRPGDSAWTDTAENKNGTCIDAVRQANTSKVSMKDLVNRYWTMHYCAKQGTTAAKTVGTGWSNWCAPMLVEGWVQRVLNAITPFAQRLSDLSENAAELKYTMPEQIGAPWEGDVALNNENLPEVGLMQLYQTVLNRAESMSIAQGAGTTSSDTTDAVNKQLVECVARLADMHMTLGAEAYSDAQNPLIASSDGTEFAGSVFCFANQVPSLLDEELALLRGRTKGVAPGMDESPFYNRLIWNFTKGVTQGEVAYVNNYNISAVNGVLDAAAAAAMYPQGHGDAYGYYLSALKGYYRLLRNPCFRWGQASMMEMLIANHVVNMDYQEEDKFAECAYNLAKIGAEVVNLTARKQWRDADGDIRSGYFDDTNTARRVAVQSTTNSLPQAFGYGEWGCRAGYGALCNWAVANAILPPDATNAVLHFKNRSIADVTRQGSASLRPLAAEVARIENTVNAMDAGLNPLGLSANTIPFDISPADFRGSLTGQDAKSHYEQIRERVGVALANAETVLGYANVYGSRLRAIENEEFDAAADAAEMEADYERRLIAVFGRPFADDIGPGKTYGSGYTGPDLYHYMYMNLEEYGLSGVASMTNALTFHGLNYKNAEDFYKAGAGTAVTVDTLVTNVAGPSMSFDLTADGLIAMPTNWVGTRACEGSLQAAYRNFLSAYVQAKRAESDYETAGKMWNWRLGQFKNTAEKDSSFYNWMNRYHTTQVRRQNAMGGLTGISTVLSFFTDLTSKMWGFSASAAGNDQIVGTAWTVPFSSVLKAATSASAGLAYSILNALQKGCDVAATVLQTRIAIKSLDAELEQQKYNDFGNRKALIESITSACSSYYSAAVNLESAYTSLLAAQESYKTVAEEGQAILAERTQARTRQVNIATQRRYADMYARIARNAALSKFATTFDVAQRYVFELAKVYGYETGIDPSSDQSKSFVNATIATRALGTRGVSIDSSVTDGGLWDLVNRMDSNFAQLKGRLGINNPDISTKWFSLRYSNCRIGPTADKDGDWRKWLNGCWSENILADKRFTSRCQPPARRTASTTEPGFIIEFATSVNLAENFFGKILCGGETTYSSSDYAVKIFAAGVDFTGYCSETNDNGLAMEPNIYLVPIGKDYMRAPLDAARTVVKYDVVDQVLPLPYDIGENELLSTDWVATLNGFDGNVDSAAKIRRHSTLRMGPVTSSTRLVGRSVWNDKWLLVIPAAELNANVTVARERFLKFVKDIRLGIQAYSRSGN